MDEAVRPQPWVRWQEEVPCPEARMLASAIDLSLAEGQLPPDVYERIKRGMADPRASEQIAAAVELRKRLAAQYSTERLGQFLSQLRSRYRVAMDRNGVAVDPTTTTATTHDAMLGEVDSLLDGLKGIYTLSSLRDVQVDRLRRNSLWILLALLVTILATQLLPALGQFTGSPLHLTLNLAAIALIGGVGSLVSIMRRSQKALDLGPIDIDPVRQISALRHGASGMLIAASVGPVLALVLFAVFAGSMIEITGLTPAIAPCIGGDKPEPTCSFAFLGQMVGFEKPSDVAKMAIWAFLAGFAEQLVPDVLDKFSKAAAEAPARSTAARSMPPLATPPVAAAAAPAGQPAPPPKPPRTPPVAPQPDPVPTS